MDATLNNTSRTREAIAIVQAIFQSEDLKFKEIIKRHEALNHQQV